MFSSLFETAKNSPFRIPFCKVQCDGNTSANTIPVLGREIQAAAAPTTEYSCEFGSNKYYALCGIGGILSCGTTHTFVVPLDLVKCRLQVDQKKYKNIAHGFKLTVKEEGARGLAKGWAPTFFGYSAQGLCKFGLYEVFKIEYAKMLGEENAYLYRTYLYLAASASAEFFADIALAPMEAAKVKIQTTAGFANTLREAIPKMMKDEGIGAFYKGLVPLWMRQIPYTMMKFACFEKTVELLYNVCAKMLAKIQTDRFFEAHHYKMKDNEFDMKLRIQLIKTILK